MNEYSCRHLEVPCITGNNYATSPQRKKVSPTNAFTRRLYLLPISTIIYNSDTMPVTLTGDQEERVLNIYEAVNVKEKLHSVVQTILS